MTPGSDPVSGGSTPSTPSIIGRLLRVRPSSVGRAMAVGRTEITASPSPRRVPLGSSSAVYRVRRVRFPSAGLAGRTGFDSRHPGTTEPPGSRCCSRCVGWSSRPNSLHSSGRSKRWRCSGLLNRRTRVRFPPPRLTRVRSSTAEQRFDTPQTEVRPLLDAPLGLLNAGAQPPLAPAAGGFDSLRVHHQRGCSLRRRGPPA